MIVEDYSRATLQQLESLTRTIQNLFKTPNSGSILINGGAGAGRTGQYAAQMCGLIEFSNSWGGSEEDKLQSSVE